MSAAVLQTEPGGSRHAAPGGRGPLQAGAVLCRLKSAANKNVTGLIKFSGKAAKLWLDCETGPVSQSRSIFLQAVRRGHVSFFCLGGQLSDVKGDNSLASDWSMGLKTGFLIG